MNSYLSQQFLDEDYKSFCPRENGSHLFFKEVGKHTVYKVVHPEHIEIYSIVRPRNKEKGKEEDFFEIIKLIPDYMDMRFFMPNNMDQFYFKSEMKTKGIVSCEKFRKAQITDKQINEIEDVGFFMQLIDPKKHSAFILIPSKNFFTPFCRKLGIGRLITESILSGISIWHQDLKMQILLLLYIGPMIRLHTEKHLLVFLKKQSKLNRAAFLIIKMHLQKLNQTSFAVGNTRIQERILIFHIRHGV